MPSKHTFINEYIANDVQQKGFSVYNYISLKELILTVQKDYLGVITIVNIPFAILTVIFWVIVYSSGNIISLIVFLGTCYLCIFIYLCIKLVIRTYYYLLVSNVVYATKGLILGNTLYKYNSGTQKLEKNLEKYELIFDEYLSKPSELQEIVAQKKDRLFSSTQKNLEKWGKILSEALKNSKNKNSSQILIPIILSFILYVICLYIFYYIGYFIGYILFYMYSLFIRFILIFKKNTALKIKEKVFSLHSSFVKMDMIYVILQKKLQVFSEGEISDISTFVEKSFWDFYKYVSVNMHQKRVLLDFLEKKWLAWFIDMKKVSQHLESQFKLPITEMIALLKQYKKINSDGIKELDRTPANKKEFKVNILQKKKILQHNLERIEDTLYKLEQIVQV